MDFLLSLGLSVTCVLQDLLNAIQMNSADIFSSKQILAVNLTDTN